MTLILTLALWLFAGCPNAETRVRPEDHPDLQAALEGLSHESAKEAPKMPEKPAPRRRRLPVRPFGGGSL